MTAESPSVVLTEDAFARATERGRRILARGPLAVAAYHQNGRIHVELNNGCAFEFPVEQAQGLAGAKAADLQVIEIESRGLGLHWPRLDADLYVPSLVKGILGSKEWMARIGAAGGSVKSVAKAQAARANGAKGGRPKRPTVV